MRSPLKAWCCATLAIITYSSACFCQNIDHWETVVYNNDTWRYIVPGFEPPSTWRQLSFNDNSWSQGPGGIGYGDGDDNTTVPNGTVSVYMRHTFNIVDTSKIEMAVLHVDYDDAFVAYINDVEVARANVAGNPPPFNQLSTGLHEAQMYSGGDPESFIIDKQTLNSCLVPGNNVLCVQAHNESSTSSDMSSHTFFSVGINDNSFTYGNVPNWFVPPVAFSSSNLPIVVINTLNQTILNDPRIHCRMGVIYNGPGNRNNMTDSLNEYNGWINIEIRGSSSQSFPKKQYALETTLDSGWTNNNWGFFGWALENDWILYAPYSDKALIRNVLAYKLGQETGHWAPRTKMCELVINGEYRGVYVFMERIKRDNYRVDISRTNPNHNAGDSLTGGYILKLDKLTNGGDGWTSPFQPWYSNSNQDILIQYEYPDYDSITPAQKTYIQNWFTQFETALDGPNFTDQSIGYPYYINIYSFIDYFIVNEVSKNVDGYRLSSFLYKNKDSKDHRINAGPLWDFNLAFGNANYCGGGVANNDWAYDFNWVCSGDNYRIPFWWERLLQDTTYQNKLKCRWDELRLGYLHTDTLMNWIDTMASYLDESQQRNFVKWPIFGTWIWPNNFVGNTYQEEIDYMKQWTLDRLNWLDANIPGTCYPWTGVEETIGIQAALFPNPLTENSRLHFMLDADAEVTVTLYNLFGQPIRTLQNGGLAAGTHIVSLDASGLNIASGAYYLQMNTNGIPAFSAKLIKP